MEIGTGGEAPTSPVQDKSQQEMSIMHSRTELYKSEPEDDVVSLGIVLSLPGSKVGEVIAYLGSVENCRLIYRRIALYELYISPYPPPRKDRGA